jgi:hypothetical protein
MTTTNDWLSQALACKALTTSDFHFLAILQSLKKDHPSILAGSQFFLQNYNISPRTFSRLSSNLQATKWIFKLDGNENGGASQFHLLNPVLDEKGLSIPDPIHVQETKDILEDYYMNNTYYENFYRHGSKTAIEILRHYVYVFVASGAIISDFQKYLHSSGLKHHLGALGLSSNLSAYDLKKLLQIAIHLNQHLTSKEA